MEELKPTRHDEHMDADIFEHPSFGTIEISRYQGGETALFGSSIIHHNGISITISHAELHRSLSNDWIFSRKPIVEVHMSPSQFADAITSLNSGSTPVTIAYLPGQGRIPPCPFQSKVAEFNEEFQKDINKLTKEFDDVIAMATECKVQKKLIKELEMLRQMFNGNIPFITRQFSEQMAKTVTEAKGEVEAFVEAKFRNAGIEKLSGEAPRLIAGPVEYTHYCSKGHTIPFGITTCVNEDCRDYESDSIHCINLWPRKK